VYLVVFQFPFFLLWIRQYNAKVTEAGPPQADSVFVFTVLVKVASPVSNGLVPILCFAGRVAAAGAMGSDLLTRISDLFDMSIPTPLLWFRGDRIKENGE
jgi:hypothetical protein